MGIGIDGLQWFVGHEQALVLFLSLDIREICKIHPSPRIGVRISLAGLLKKVVYFQFGALTCFEQYCRQSARGLEGHLVMPNAPKGTVICLEACNLVGSR